MIYRFIYCLLLSVCSINAYASIGVSPIILDLVGKDADAEISVKNFDTKNNAYVEITPYRLLKPENPASAKTRVLHPEKDGLLVFPAKLVLLPGQTQYVRIIKTSKSLSTDQVYEIDFIPKISTLLNHKTKEGLVLGIRVIVGYGARVTLRPDTPKTAISITRKNNELIIQNNGNSLINITSCSQQIAHKKTEIPLPSYTLFAGQQIKKQLVSQSKVTLETAFIGKSLAQLYSN